MTIGIIGCGHMGSALAQALILKKVGRVLVSNPFKPRIKVKWTVDNKRIAKTVDIVVIALKPNTVAAVLDEISDSLGSKKIVVSIAAGVSLKKLKKHLPRHRKIVRAMPNLAAQVFDAITVWKPFSGLSTLEKRRVSNLLNAFGKSIEVRNEKLIDMATAVSGSGPAYVAAFLETLSMAAKSAGFSTVQARQLALETVDGTLDYIKETGVNFGDLKNAVQTKGGTTEAAFKVLKKKKWQRILEKAVTAAYRHARTLSY